MKNIEISVVIPVYNSESILPELYSQLKTTLDKLAVNYEVIFCEDCGNDNSWAVLTELKEKDPGIITAVKLSKNYGQHSATMCGLTFARGEIVITMDDDLQHSPGEIVKLLDAYKRSDADVIYGDFQVKQHSKIRNAGSYSIKKTSKFFRQGKGKGSSFRLISRSIIDKILLHHQYFVFIDKLIFWYTDNIEFVQVEHHKRVGSKSTYSRSKLFHLFSNLMFFYTTFPLKLMVYGGMIISFITFLMGVNAILKKIFFNIQLGYTSIIVAILFSTSIIIFSLGLIGEYLSRMYQIQNQRPPFNIKKVL